MNQEEFERLPAGGVGVEEALARLKRKNPDAYAAHVSIMHRRPRGGRDAGHAQPGRRERRSVAPTPTKLRPAGLVGVLSSLLAVGPVRCRGQGASNPGWRSSAIELRMYMSAARAAAGVASFGVNSPFGPNSIRTV
jgi:hypothetical protein